MRFKSIVQSLRYIVCECCLVWITDSMIYIHRHVISLQLFAQLEQTILSVQILQWLYMVGPQHRLILMSLL